MDKYEVLEKQTSRIIDAIEDVATNSILTLEEKEKWFEHMTQNIYSLFDSFSSYAKSLDEMQLQTKYFFKNALDILEKPKEDDPDEQDN